MDTHKSLIEIANSAADDWRVMDDLTTSTAANIQSAAPTAQQVARLMASWMDDETYRVSDPKGGKFSNWNFRVVSVTLKVSRPRKYFRPEHKEIASADRCLVMSSLGGCCLLNTPLFSEGPWSVEEFLVWSSDLPLGITHGGADKRQVPAATDEQLAVFARMAKDLRQSILTSKSAELESARAAYENIHELNEAMLSM